MELQDVDLSAQAQNKSNHSSHEQFVNIKDIPAMLEQVKPKDPKKDSLLGAAFNLSNSTIGSGVLGLPFVLREQGMVVGLAFIAFGALLSSISQVHLQKASTMMLRIDSTRRDYEHIGDYLYGRFVGFLVKLSVVLLNFGACLSYFIILGDLLLPVFRFAIGEDVWVLQGFQGRFFVTLMVAIPVVLMSTVKRIADMRFFSYVSLTAVLAFSIFVIVGFATGATDKVGNVVLSKFNLGMFRVLGIIVFAFGSHTNICPINREFHHTNQHKVAWAIHMGVFLSFSFYVLVAVFGYLSFLDATTPNMIEGYPTTVLNSVFRAVFSISIILTYPMVSYPCRVSLDNLFFDFIDLLKKAIFCKHRAKQMVDSRPPSQIKYIFTSETLRVVAGTFFIGITAFILAVTFPKVEVVFSLTGSTAATMTSFIFPPLFYIKLTRNRWLSWQVMTAILVLAIGAISGFSVTAISIYELVK